MVSLSSTDWLDGRSAADFFSGLGLKQPSKRGRVARGKGKGKAGAGRSEGGGAGGDAGAGREEGVGWRLADDEVRDLGVRGSDREYACAMHGMMHVRYCRCTCDTADARYKQFKRNISRKINTSIGATQTRG